MERHPDKLSEGIVRADGNVTPPNASDVVGAVLDYFIARSIPVSSRTKGQIAKQAKALLEDGFDAALLYQAGVLAIRRASPHLMQNIASDLVVARTGEWIPDRDVYRKKLEDEIEIRKAELRRLS